MFSTRTYFIVVVVFAVVRQTARIPWRNVITKVYCTCFNWSTLIYVYVYICLTFKKLPWYFPIYYNVLQSHGSIYRFHKISIFENETLNSVSLSQMYLDTLRYSIYYGRMLLQTLKRVFNFCWTALL